MEGSLTNKQESPTAFRSLMAALKELEEKNQKTVYFKKMDPNELGEEDEKFYNDFILGNLNTEKIKAYLNKVVNSGNESQKGLYNYIANNYIVK
ncbi:MAG: hypothetical protein AAB913_02050 [Patescibacteria group bacterium]|mgnify:CR=1 FL=1